jgi:hypothetical protein
MKLHVVYDGKGKIVAAVGLHPEHATEGPHYGRLRPVLKPGHFCADVEVPEEQSHLTIADACRKLIVDTAHSAPRLKMAEN